MWKEMLMRKEVSWQATSFRCQIMVALVRVTMRMEMVEDILIIKIKGI
jgi:hypothetical protein